VELYSALFRSMPDIEARCWRAARGPGSRRLPSLAETDTLEFLRRFVVQLSPRGQFAEGPPEKEAEDPRSAARRFSSSAPGPWASPPPSRARSRISPFARTSPGLLKIVGLDPPRETDEKAETFEPGDEPEEVLLSKPANPEQIRIAVRLEREGCVLVQGPRGRAKTHTIAT